MLNKTKRFILNLIYPNRCPVCNAIIGFCDSFCEKCTSKISRYTDVFGIVGSEGFSAAFVYDENISPAVILLKNGVCGNAAYALGTSLAKTLMKEGVADNINVIIPVPLYKSDRRKRGYNQSELIAKEISRELCVPVVRNAIYKTKKTASQKTLTKSEREVNLRGAFTAAVTSRIKGNRILLIDDVCTTGSTLTEITSLLKKCGAAAVYCASCCKTPSRPKEM